MSTIKSNKKIAPALNAILDKTSLIFEKIEISESVLNTLEKGVKTIGHITNTTFELGVPKDSNNMTFQIRVKYAVDLLINQDKIKFCTYESKTYTTFKVSDTNNIDWKNVPKNILTPYFSFVHSFVRRRAEEHLLAAGYSGIILPLPNNLNISQLDS